LTIVAKFLTFSDQLGLVSKVNIKIILKDLENKFLNIPLPIDLVDNQFPPIDLYRRGERIGSENL
jgi:hypothetical protein